MADVKPPNRMGLIPRGGGGGGRLPYKNDRGARRTF